MIDGGEAALAGGLDLIHSELVELFAYLRRHYTSRGGNIDRKTADTRVVELLPASRFRHMATLFNDANVNAYVALGPRASTDNYTIRLAANAYYETPAGYTGPITAVWDPGPVGQMRVTELA